jgi:hypothetical protein
VREMLALLGGWETFGCSSSSPVMKKDVVLLGLNPWEVSSSPELGHNMTILLSCPLAAVCFEGGPYSTMLAKPTLLIVDCWCSGTGRIAVGINLTFKCL